MENALRRFKRKVQQEDVIKEVKRHSFYLKPGEKARVKQALARKRARKRSAKNKGNLHPIASIWAAATRSGPNSFGRVRVKSAALPRDFAG